MLYFNTNVGATLYRTIRGGASATVEKSRRVERMNAADRAVDSRQVERLEREIAGVEARDHEIDQRLRHSYGRSERTLSLIHAAAEQKRQAGDQWDRVEGRIENRIQDRFRSRDRGGPEL